MTKEELKEIIARVLKRIQDEETPKPACLFGDWPDCDYATDYGIGEVG